MSQDFQDVCLFSECCERSTQCTSKTWTNIGEHRGGLEDENTYHDRVAEPIDNGLTLAGNTLPLHMAAHIGTCQGSQRCHLTCAHSF